MNNSRPQIINHILEDLDDQAADNLESYIGKLENHLRSIIDCLHVDEDGANINNLPKLMELLK